MKSSKFINMCVSLALVVTISSCGKDNKNGSGGDAAVQTVLQANGQAGNPGSIYSIEEFRDRVQSGNFAEASTSGVYLFAKKNGGWKCSTYNEYWGARALNSDSTIVRNFPYNRGSGCTVQMSFNEDEFTGNNLTELVANMTAKINAAFSQHDVNTNVTVKKYINGYAYKAYPTNYTCQVYEQNCSVIKAADSKIWEIKVDGEWLVIDLTKAAIKQPILRHTRY